MPHDNFQKNKSIFGLSMDYGMCNRAITFPSISKHVNLVSPFVNK